MRSTLAPERAFGWAAGLAIGLMLSSLPVLAQAPAAPTPATTASAPADAGASGATQGHAIQNLAGRWTGKGWIEASSGSREEVKCIVTYILKDGGTGIEQNLRCAGASYSVDAQSRLKVSGDRITGTWEERKYSSNGTIAGQVRTGGFNVVINGENFTARMSVASGKGSQTLNITPQGLSVTKITVGLTRS
jgi:hypothetical protein